MERDTVQVEDFGVRVLSGSEVTGSVLMLEASFAANIKDETPESDFVLGDQGGADLYPLSIYREEHGVLVNLEPKHISR